MAKRRVLVFGTFDILHPGHVALLQTAARYGELTVCLPSDETVRTMKGHAPVNSLERREARLKILSFVDRVVVGDRESGSFNVLRRNQVDCVVLGHDQEALAEALIDYSRRQGRRLVLIKAPEYRASVYKSSRFRPAVRSL